MWSTLSSSLGGRAKLIWACLPAILRGCTGGACDAAVTKGAVSGVSVINVAEGALSVGLAAVADGGVMFVMISDYNLLDGNCILI